MKRAIDLIFTVFGIIILLPLLVFLACIVRIVLGHPILFKQQRVGLNNKKFIIYKFRSMTNKSDTDGNLLPDKDRLNAFGRFMRSTSLDELPELLNVLKGDMSLVGPRPLLVDYLSYYSKEQRRRHDVKPGITGWAQINGRNAISWDEKFKLDLWYVDNYNVLRDLQILYMTFFRVFGRQGINHSKYETMPFFKG